MDKKNKKNTRTIKLIIVGVIILVLVWFLIIYPLIDFKQKEEKLEKAGIKYFEINSSLLPTGNRVKTVTIKELYSKDFLDSLYKVYSKKNLCSLDDGFVKVKMVDGEYKYYTYLKCGVLSSLTDHEGPSINLKGEDKITVERGSNFTDPGIKSVIDDNDGKLSVNDVTVKNNVDTSEVGTYEIIYSVSDSLGNKTEKIRTIVVNETLASTVERNVGDNGYYQGQYVNNYISFSGMLFRIVNIDDDGVRIVSAQDIASVNYDGLEEWLNDYYYKHLIKKSKDYLLNTKYCQDTITDVGATECQSVKKDNKVGLLSIQDINNSVENGLSYLYPDTIVWTSNSASDSESYATRDYFVGVDSQIKYMKFDKTYSFMVRPLLTLDREVKIVSGDGTKDSPYSIGDVKTAKSGDKLNTRHTGEYVEANGMLYRLIEKTEKNTMKAISIETVQYGGDAVYISYDNETSIYNPKEEGNIGYKIENELSKYIVNEYFVKQEIDVPIYSSLAEYNKEKEVKKYKVKYASPSMFEMFSTKSEVEVINSFWLRDSSIDTSYKNLVAAAGNVLYTPQSPSVDAAVKVVGHFDKDCSIVSGNGTKDEPYKITK